MPAIARANLLQYLSPLRLIGPLADKELRVASRRIWSHVLPGAYTVLLCILMVSSWYGFMVGAGLYFGTRLRTMTTAVAAAALAFLCANYLVGRICSPLLMWLWSTVLAGILRRNNSYAMLLGFVVSMGGAFLVDVVLAPYLWRRARQNVRRYVF